jgi:hypothetical protein
MKKFTAVGALLCICAAFCLMVARPAGAVTYSVAQNAPSTLAIAATGTTGTVTATLPAAAGKFTYIEGFTISSTGSTAAASVNVTVTGTTNTLNYAYLTVAGATTLNTTLDIRFPSPIPSSAVNTTVVVTLPALGAGCTNANVAAYGFSQ